eukprot:m.193786 g.193786  ORF g.193786 m.193786 type:complete len:186 (+) comp14885_c0_seq1:27-584(+)
MNVRIAVGLIVLVAASAFAAPLSPQFPKPYHLTDSYNLTDSEAMVTFTPNKTYSVPLSCSTQTTGCAGARKTCNQNQVFSVPTTSWYINPSSANIQGFYGDGTTSNAKCTFSNCFYLPGTPIIVAQEVSMYVDSESCPTTFTDPCPGHSHVDATFTFTIYEYEGETSLNRTVACPPCKAASGSHC